MNIAVIGAGISGLGCAYQLVKRGHRVDIFEARDRIGGHTATYDVQIGTRRSRFLLTFRKLGQTIFHAKFIDR